MGYSADVLDIHFAPYLNEFVNVNCRVEGEWQGTEARRMGTRAAVGGVAARLRDNDQTVGSEENKVAACLAGGG
jgi:hypothetical protein